MAWVASSGRESALLDCWERGVGLDRWQRDDALLGGVAAPRALGARNLALLALRSTLFGRSWPLRSCCPACASDCSFEVDSVALAGELEREPVRERATLDWAGRPVEARAPTVDDLRAVSGHADAAAAARALLARCVTGGLAGVDDGAVAVIGEAMERLDPAAAIGFAMHCPDCGHGWSAMIDIGDAVWAEVRRAAEASLVEVDALARAYGWSEAEVMGLSPTRRAAYLQLVGAA